MISLAPLKSKEDIKNFFNKIGLKINEFSGCVTAQDGKEILGFCLYDLTDKKIIIRHIEPISDLGLADGILRSALHVATEKSIMDAFYDSSISEEFLENIKFIKDKNEKTLDVDKLFQSCCGCGK